MTDLWLKPDSILRILFDHAVLFLQLWKWRLSSCTQRASLPTKSFAPLNLCAHKWSNYQKLTLPEQKLLVLMVLLEWSELRSHSFPSSSEKGESDRGEHLSFVRRWWRTRRGMRLRGLPFSGDFFSCSTQHLSPVQIPNFFKWLKFFFFKKKTESTCRKFSSPHIPGMDPLCFTCFPSGDWTQEEKSLDIPWIVALSWCGNTNLKLSVGTKFMFVSTWVVVPLLLTPYPTPTHSKPPAMV